MSGKFTGLIIVGLVAAMLAAAFWTLTHAPVGRLVPVHFSLDGRPNGWAPAVVAVFVTPGIAATVGLLRIVLPAITPRGENLRRSGAAFDTIWIAVTGALAAGQALIVCAALGYARPGPWAQPLMLGLLFMVIGNVLPKLRWNYVVGIRTPWTLADERVWDKTHRFGGWAMVLGGGVLAVLALVSPNAPRPGLIAGVIGAMALAPVAKSYLLWRDRDRGATPSNTPS